MFLCTIYSATMMPFLLTFCLSRFYTNPLAGSARGLPFWSGSGPTRRPNPKNPGKTPGGATATDPFRRSASPCRQAGLLFPKHCFGVLTLITVGKISSGRTLTGCVHWLCYQRIAVLAYNFALAALPMNPSMACKIRV